MPVFRSDDVTRYDMHGSRFDAMVSPATGSHELCAWRLRVPPGTPGVAHRPTREEVLLVTGGQLGVEVDGERADLRPGDVALIPAGSELSVHGGPEGASAWVTSSRGLRAVTADGAWITPPWAG